MTVPHQDTGLHVDSEARAEQVRAVSVGRWGPARGRLPFEALKALDDALRRHLALWSRWGRTPRRGMSERSARPAAGE